MIKIEKHDREAIWGPSPHSWQHIEQRGAVPAEPCPNFEPTEARAVKWVLL